MTVEYRLTAIGDDDVERQIAIIGQLTVPPNSLLVISLPAATIDSDLARLRSEWREFVQKYEGWKNIPTIFARAGDVRFACLTRLEAPE